MGRTFQKTRAVPGRTRAHIAQTRKALEWLEVRKSAIHRRGVFARRDIPAGTRLVEYVGLPVSKKKAADLCLKQNTYVFQVDGDSDVNGKVSWNLAGMVNHSCEPNCESNPDEHDRIWIFSIRPIARGEELTFNYGYDLDNFMNYPCHCGSPNCVGYMVAEHLFPALHRLLAPRE